jgi:hypothetical protein
MNELLQATFWVLGLFSLMTALLYVLTVIDPRTESRTAVPAMPTMPAQLTHN